MVFALPKWRLTMCVVLRPSCSLAKQGKDVTVCLSPGPPLSECCLGTAGHEAAHVPSLSLRSVWLLFWHTWVLLPPIVLQLHEALHPSTVLAASLLTDGSCHFLAGPQSGWVSFIPQVSRRDSSQNHIKAQVCYLQETLKGNLNWCLQFTSKEIEAQKGSGCPPHHSWFGSKLSMFPL